MTRPPRKLQRCVAVLLALVLGAGTASAGLVVRPTEGIVLTGADGVVLTGADGLVLTGADKLSYAANGIVLTGADGVVLTGADNGAHHLKSDGVAYTGTNVVRASRADGVALTGADGIVLTGADGIVLTGADGTTCRTEAVTVRRASGVVLTGADGIVLTGADGISRSGADGVMLTGADGIVLTGADDVSITAADGVVLTGADGLARSVPPNGVVLTGADCIVLTGTDGVVLTGADGLKLPETDGVVLTGADAGHQSGLQSIDPELALLLDSATDDRGVNAVVVFHRQVSEQDIAALRGFGVLGGTRYRALPMVSVTATRAQLEEISRLSSVRSIWGARTLQWSAADASRALVGAPRVAADRDLTARNNGLPLSGRGVTVAVLDTGVDATHSDLAGRVARNVELAEAPAVNPTGFSYPVNVEGPPNTDQAGGHGTFVAGLVAGSGALSGGKFAGVAPGANILGLSAGDASLLSVLSGFDYLLAQGPAPGVRVVNCSFSANTVFDPHDPVNVATRMLAERNVNVVFSAGNTGPGLNSMNPYAMAPWVVSVGATDARGRLAHFSARGAFGHATFRPTLVAPGAAVVGPRATTSATGTPDAEKLSASEAPYYAVASGTSFSAPQVAGAIALMLEANRGLTAAQVRDILQRTATPLAPYYAHEVGAGMLNAHAAALEAAFPERRIGHWRAALDRNHIRFVKDPAHEFSGTAVPGEPHEASLSVPDGALFASVQIAWGPLWSANDLSLSVYDALGVRRAHENYLNLPGLTGRRERALVQTPGAGAWRVRVANTLGFVGTPQSYTGVFEVARVEYPKLQDVDGLSQQAREDIRQALRTFVMFPVGQKFRPEDVVTRAELAAALVYGARVPQYVPRWSSFTDVKDRETMLYAESAQAAPGGPLFEGSAPGGSFRPTSQAERLTAAVALVRAAGLRAEAERSVGAVEALDATELPAEYRGYVKVALSRGLLTNRGGYFRPRSGLTRAELARAMSVVARLAAE